MVNSETKIQMVAGFTTFTTVIYISFVIPGILQVAGMDSQATFALVCIVIGIAGMLNGFIAQIPTILGPSIGLSAYLVSLTIGDNPLSWQIAMGAAFWGAILLFISSITGLRYWLIKSIPESLKIAIGAGIGLFIGLVGLRNSGIIVGDPVNLVKLGNLQDPMVLLAILSFIVLIFCVVRKIKLSFFISILVTSLLALIVHSLQIQQIIPVTNGASLLGNVNFTGIVSLPSDLLSVLGQVDLKNSFTYGLSGTIFTFFLINMFDSSGSMIAVTKQANIDLMANNNLGKLRRALLVDSSSSAISTFFGVGSMTTFVESNAGVSVGGRDGRMPLTVGVLFLLLMFFSPIVQFIPLFATTGSLLYISYMMVSNLQFISWKNITEALPAFILVVMMPFTFSISWGMAFGFITYVIVKILNGEFNDINLPLILISVLFIINFIIL